MLQTRARHGRRQAARQIEGKTMAGHLIPHFQNDAGHARIAIGVTEFKCVGASAPFDHPHVFLDLGGDSEKVCPYCSTLYVYDPALHADETVPAGALYTEKAA